MPQTKQAGSVSEHVVLETLQIFGALRVDITGVHAQICGITAIFQIVRALD
jgi:hypothetical protein